MSGINFTQEADHAFGCCGAHAIARHNVIRDLLAKYYLQSVAFVADTDQAVPELGPGTAAVADVRVVEKGLDVH